MQQIDLKIGNVLDKLKEIPDNSVLPHNHNLYILSSANNIMHVSNCKICGKKIIRRGKKIGRFCSLKCKATWQLSQKPVNKLWLEEKYLGEGLSTYQIAKIVKRNPKRVYEWLKQFGIQTRSRAETLSENSYGHLIKQGAVPNPFLGKKHNKEAKRKMSIKASVPRPYLRSEKNGMFGVRGSQHPNWQGGITAERQETYNTTEWKKVSKIVWERDKGTCQLCGIKYPYAAFHLHHIIPFRVKEERLNPQNLITLCADCHHWVHSKANTNKKYLRLVKV